MIDQSYSDAVVSTRVRLARNIEGFPFPSHLKDEKQAREIIRMVSSGISRIPRLSEFRLYYMNNISEAEADCLKENHLISPNLIAAKRFSAAVIDHEEGAPVNISIMINEEDHLREQCIIKGLNLRLAYDTMSEIDSGIAETMKFAYDEQLGFLTACPTNLGTGLRASVMMFLPALTMNGVMPKVIRNISRLGLTVRGMYGEGSNAEGYMYQISNEVTLGVTEEEIIARVEEVVKKVYELELAEREPLKSGAQSLTVRDNCLRSYGILTNCALLSTEELVRRAADVKLGALLGFIDIPDVSPIDELVVKMRPANINAAAKQRLSPVERDRYRAEFVGKKLISMTIRNP